MHRYAGALPAAGGPLLASATSTQPEYDHETLHRLRADRSGAAGCTADVRDPGESPEVHIEPGRSPDIDVRPADIDVRRDTQTIVVPDIDVNEPNRNP
jgi:hypothetical protein